MYDSPRAVPTSSQQLALWIAGALFTLACFGFLTRIATLFDGLDLGGLLFGLFHVSMLQNVVHLLLGAAVLVTARSRRGCRIFLAVAGLAMIAVVVYGQVDSTPVLPGLVPVSDADTWLHVTLALTMMLACLLPTLPRSHVSAR